MNLIPNEALVPIYQDHPKNISGGTGGWVGDLFIVCGGNSFQGKDYYKECYRIGKENTSFHGNMKERRKGSASIVLDDKLWIIGGIDDSEEVKRTTEYISAHDSSQKDGPELPIGLASHAVVKVNETLSMLIGGFVGVNNTRERSHTKCIYC